MALAEQLVKQTATKTPENYASKVRWTALIYFVLNAVSVVIIIAIVWRVQFFVTLSQRSNVETLTLLIIFILALYYLLSSFKGFVGALRILWLNTGGGRDKERRKHDAIPTGGAPKYVTFDKAIRLEGKPNETIIWQVADEAGKLGELEIDGVKATYYPIKDGMDDSVFEFLADQIQKALEKRTPDANLQITQWSTINEDQASAYHSMVQAFQNIENQLGNKGPVWPTGEIGQEDFEAIQQEIRRLVPALRNEAHLPKLEYEVSYNVPVLPEPLAMLQLTRKENRADPIVTMGCASIVMFFVLLVLVFFILLPPWVPSK